MAVAAILALTLLTQESDPIDDYFDPGTVSPWSVNVTTRASYSSGRVTDTAIRYRDLFRPGHGVSLQVNHSLGWSPTSELSGTLQFGWDRFPGTRFRDDFGDLLAPEDADQTSLLVGGRFVRWFTGYYPDYPIVADVRLGGGIVHHAEVLADFEVGGTRVDDQQLFRSTVAPMVEAGIRGGVASTSFTFTLGIGVRFVGGPNRGRDVTSAVAPRTRTDFILDLGWELRF